ncbi:PSD1 and planctomycete cytochrome C domain-containing protein [Paludisphaera mucosa]|uniref:PSD1 and planctomycete cytochrome C domain-containing protein n=1 Tax=Paludisphaera mucosa TaxID=3030827 RepID=A0ABT6FB55_9BACT|nr:PSD1 and planctomycete cytochrome C domain-containing protein [Paludisphaera mucosa]MDG3004815.1 PSD1 and planctomycete cytochrome C domain-containing protein [Paludisphaera mucosa]
MIQRSFLTLAVALAVPVAAAAVGEGADPAAAPDAAKLEFFEKKIRPLLVDNCYNCHSANTKAASGLRVDDRKGLVDGGDRGAAVVPGKPEESLLLQSVGHLDDAPKMPPKKKLGDEQVADLARWVAEGAAWPVAKVAATQITDDAKYARLRAEHWAWQPLKAAAVPEVRDASWPRGDVDRFILAKLEGAGLAPVGDADRTALIRRATFDLTGLPPTPEETSAFVADEAADAFAKVVDRLLASPAFGERWGRHWLDVARYADSTGGSRNVPYPHAWRYRDYVVDAFNRDKPFDRFVREQVAGDLLPAASQAEKDEHAVATGFLAIGQKDVNQRFKVRFVMDNVDEQIDAVSRGILGVTASCARCHDHKFDPIPTKDYYALAGVFRSTDLCAGVRNKMGGGGLDYYDNAMLVVLGEAAAKKDDPALTAKIAAATKAYEEARAEFQKIRGTPEGLKVQANGRPYQFQFRMKMNQRQNELLELTDPAVTGQVALGVRDAKEIADTEVRIRGEAEKLGPVVPRGFLSAVPVKAPEVPSNQSGRLELARWLTDPANPLTSRVFANRAWRHLFGRGIVKTVDNFGLNGDAPSHPELLDHLAAKFVADGWSVKKLVRSLVLTRAYALSSETRDANVQADPANRLVWRHSPRRLTGEEIRDATLAAAGSLDPSRPPASPTKALKVVELPNNSPLARGILDQALASPHRSVYLPLLRGLTPTSLEVFDFAEQGNVTGDRETTTVATQALYFLNDPLVRRQSLRLAERLLARAELDDAGRLDLAYRLALGRSPTAAESDRGRAFLAEYESAAAAQPEPEPEPTPTPAPAPAVAAADGAPKPPAQVIDPDQVIPVDAPVKEEAIRASSPRAAAWAGFCQALIGSAEFRYVR